MLCSVVTCSSKVTCLLSKDFLSRPERNTPCNFLSHMNVGKDKFRFTQMSIELSLLTTNETCIS